MIGETVHPSDGLAVGVYIKRVAGEERATITGVMQRGRTRKMPAAAQQGQIVAEIARFAFPQTDRPVVTHDPFLIVGMNVNRALEGVRPVDHCAVEMRMRD